MTGRPSSGNPDVKPPEQVRHDRPTLVRVSGVELCHEAFGEPDDPTMLLVTGLGFQLVHWPEELCRQLAAEGFHVVRFDNRDSGASTHLPGQRYTLEDMADDAVGLLDALGVASAHVVGASLGGMIAQTMAIRHPGRVRSLASLMSTTGRRGEGRTSLRVLRHLLARPPRTDEEALERRVRVLSEVGSTGFAPRISTSSAGSTRSRSDAIPTPAEAAVASSAPYVRRATGPRRSGCSGRPPW